MRKLKTSRGFYEISYANSRLIGELMDVEIDYAKLPRNDKVFYTKMKMAVHKRNMRTNQIVLAIKIIEQSIKRFEKVLELETAGNWFIRKYNELRWGKVINTTKQHLDVCKRAKTNLENIIYTTDSRVK